MPAYIIETGRSYPNPVDSEDYDRTYTSDEHPSFGSGYQIEIEGLWTRFICIWQG